MRHYFCKSLQIATLAFSVAALPADMVAASTQAVLVAFCCAALLALTHLTGAVFAVAVAVITVAAHQHGGLALSARVASGCRLHRPMGADGGWAGQGLAFREILTPATSPSRARGTTSVGTFDGIGRCRACFLSFYGRISFYPLLDCLTTRSGQTSPLTHQFTTPQSRARRARGRLHSPFGLLPTTPGARIRTPVQYLCRQIYALSGSHSHSLSMSPMTMLQCPGRSSSTWWTPCLNAFCDCGSTIPSSLSSPRMRLISAVRSAT